MTADERRAYIKGALTVCLELDIKEDAVVDLCHTLGIAAEELLEIRYAEHDSAPFVPGVLGAKHGT
jgi:hypothetical protein